jgi:hypothetical protein
VYTAFPSGVVYCLDDTTIYSTTQAAKGYIGESLIDDFYRATGRMEILEKIQPTISGPDKIYMLPNGTIEIHEVKTYKNWPGANALSTESNGRRLHQLSDDWIDNWVDRVLRNSNSSSQERQAALFVQQARKQKKLVRIFDEINLSQGQMRSSVVLPKGNSMIILQPHSKSVRIRRLNQKFATKLSKYSQSIFSGRSTVRVMKESPKSFDDYEKIAKQIGPKTTAYPAAVTPDGKLILSLKRGGTVGVAVFAFEFGESYYQYIQGDILKPEFERKLVDGAIKASAMAGVEAVVVFLAVSPQGIVISGISLGTYIVVDTALTVWRENQAMKYLNRNDFMHLGIEIDSVLDINDPMIPLNIEEW